MRKNVKRWLLAIAVYAVLLWGVPFATGPGDAWTRILIAHTLLVVAGAVGGLVGMILAPLFRGKR